MFMHASHPTPHRPLFPSLSRPAGLHRCEDGKALGRMYDDRQGREQRSPTASVPSSNPRSLTKQIQPASDREHEETCVHFTAAAAGVRSMTRPRTFG
jgi:hypothetical protein